MHLSICQIPPAMHAFCLLLLLALRSEAAITLVGVTTSSDHPQSSTLQSFFHELIAEIAALSDFSYTIRLMPGAKYGGAVGEMRPEGTLIGEVYSNKADFVIADLEITPDREKFVEFTRPFMRSQLAALVRRYPPPTNHTNGAHSQHHAADKDRADNEHAGEEQATDDQDESAGTLRSLLYKHRKRAVVRGSLAEQYFRTSPNFQVYHLLPSSVPTMSGGVQLVNSTADTVLISDAARLDLIAAHECQYKVVKPIAGKSNEIGANYTVEYAIGMQRDSPFLQLFDTAIEQLEHSGKLKALIDSYWTDYCAQRRANEQDREQTNDASSLAPLACCWTSVLLLAITAALAPRHFTNHAH